MDSALELNTKSKLLQAGVKVFGDHGYIGGSVRQIAEAAGTNIAAIKYHYSSKEELWRAVVGHLYRKLSKAILENEAEWPNMTARERVIDSTRQYILFSAQHPELHRITLFEMIQKGDRLEWLSKNHMRQFTERSLAWISMAQDNGVYPANISSLHLFYITIAAAQTIFLMAPQIEHSFGVDVFADTEVEKQIEAVIGALLVDSDIPSAPVDIA